MATKPLAIICDLDGTLSLKGDRDPYDYDSAMEDAPNWPVIRLAAAIQLSLWDNKGNHPVILIVSGREEQSRNVVEYWLWKHKILTQGRRGIYLRPTNDNRADHVVKQEIYTKYIAPFYEVIAVLDDRNSVVAMWRSLGLLCLQVADGDF